VLPGEPSHATHSRAGANGSAVWNDLHAPEPSPWAAGLYADSTPNGKAAEEFDRTVFAREEEKMKRPKVARLHSLAEALTYQLTLKQ
jgi:hypothetical protein